MIRKQFLSFSQDFEGSISRFESWHPQSLSPLYGWLPPLHSSSRFPRPGISTVGDSEVDRASACAKHMRITKPSFVSHGKAACGGRRVAIYSVDAHPDGTRFATGGGDHNVRLWKFTSVVNDDKAASADVTPPKCLLATLSRHQGTVNCVRWSHDGRYLASASADHLVMTWQYVSGGSGSVPGNAAFGSAHQNIEEWVCRSTLRAHTMDVCEVAWSPDDTKLASSSIDNRVVVWHAEPQPGGGVSTAMTPLAVLRGHCNWAKGLAWDPVGKYLATTSDDKSVIVWSCADWSQVERVEEPYRLSDAQTLKRQLSWSPDGAAIASAYAYEEPRHVAWLIPRSKWSDADSAIQLVGHKKPVNTVRFSPRLYRLRVNNGLGVVCAVGSKDSAVTVWLAGRPKPIVILRNLFAGTPALDLSWAPDGRSLLACSADGDVVCVRFEYEELGGDPLDNSESAEHLRSIYGDGHLGASTNLVENPAQLVYEEAAAAKLRHGNQARGPACPISSRRNGKTGVLTKETPSPTKQSESLTRDGRRRIQPAFITAPTLAPVGAIPPSGDGQAAAAAPQSIAEVTISPMSRRLGRAVHPDSSDILARHDAPNQTAKRRVQPTLLVSSAAANTKNGEKSRPSKKPRSEKESLPKVTTVSNGTSKRSKADTLVASDGASKTTVPTHRNASSTTAGSASSSTAPTTKRKRQKSAKDAAGLGSGSRGSASASQQRRSEDGAARGERGANVAFRRSPLICASLPRLERGGVVSMRLASATGDGAEEGSAILELCVIARGSSSKQRQQGMPPMAANASSATSMTAAAAARLTATGGSSSSSAPALAGVPHAASNGGSSGRSLDVGDNAETRIRCLHNSELRWGAHLRGRAVAVTGNDEFVSVATDSGGIIVLGSKQGEVTTRATAFVWDVFARRALHAELEVAPFRDLVNAALTPLWAPAPFLPRDSLTVSSAARAPSGDGSSHDASVSTNGAASDKPTSDNEARMGVTSRGIPVVLVARRADVGEASHRLCAEVAGFIYDGAMQCWMRVADPRDSLGSDFATTLMLGGAGDAGRRGVAAAAAGAASWDAEPLALILACVAEAADRLRAPGGRGVVARSLLPNGASAAGRGANGASRKEARAQRDATRLHIECKLSAARTLGSRPDFERWLRTYAQRLSEDADEQRLRALCDELLGPQHRRSERNAEPASRSVGVVARHLGNATAARFAVSRARAWEPTIAGGMSRRKLLRTLVLPAASGNRALQRLVDEFAQALDAVEGNATVQSRGNNGMLRSASQEEVRLRTADSRLETRIGSGTIGF